MNSIIHYLLVQNQYLLQIILFLFKFICKFIPLRQFAFDDSHSPEYQKFKIDKPPRIVKHEVWHYYDYIPYIKERYGVDINPVNRRKPCDIPDDTICPCCNAPKEYLYKNNGSKGQLFLQSLLKQVQFGRIKIYKTALSSLSLLQSYSCSPKRPQAFYRSQMRQQEMLLLPPKPQKG